MTRFCLVMDLSLRIIPKIHILLKSDTKVRIIMCISYSADEELAPRKTEILDMKNLKYDSFECGD